MLTGFHKYRSISGVNINIINTTVKTTTNRRLFSEGIKSKFDRNEFNHTVGAMRNFFKQKGWKEVTMQHQPSIMAACEDPWTLVPFVFDGETWPLPQTSQMWLEYELLKDPDVEGIYTLSTSYREEPHPIAGRHQTIFPMFEFESKGDFGQLMALEKDLLEHLGFGERRTYKNISYNEACQELGVEDVDAEEERELENRFGSVVFLHRFPERTSPFWNMKRDSSAFPMEKDGMTVWKPENIARKIDVILCGQETIGSAERSTDKDQMRETFETISDGQYAKKIRDLFGEQRVDQELDEFFSLDFIPRYGGGIGVHRMIRAMKRRGLIPQKPLYPDYSIV